MEEATITGIQHQGQGGMPAECQMSTDDLTLMIGEAAIRERQAAKIQMYLGRQVQTATERALRSESELLAARGTAAQLESTVADNAARISENNAAHASALNSLHERIRQLERQVHEVALERDALKRDIAELNAKPAAKGKVPK